MIDENLYKPVATTTGLLSLEARHSISLEIAKRKKQQFETDIFMPKTTTQPRTNSCKMSSDHESATKSTRAKCKNATVCRDYKYALKKRRLSLAPRKVKIQHPESFPVGKATVNRLPKPMQQQPNLKETQNNDNGFKARKCQQAAPVPVAAAAAAAVAAKEERLNLPHLNTFYTNGGSKPNDEDQAQNNYRNQQQQRYYNERIATRNDSLTINDDKFEKQDNSETRQRLTTTSNGRGSKLSSFKTFRASNASPQKSPNSSPISPTPITTTTTATATNKVKQELERQQSVLRLAIKAAKKVRNGAAQIFADHHYAKATNLLTVKASNDCCNLSARAGRHAGGLTSPGSCQRSQAKKNKVNADEATKRNNSMAKSTFEEKLKTARSPDNRSSLSEFQFADNEQSQASGRPSSVEKTAADKKRQSTSSAYSDYECAGNEQSQASGRTSLEKRADKNRQSTSSAFSDYDCAGNEQSQASECPSLEKKADKRRQSTSSTYADNDFADNEQHQTLGCPLLEKRADKKRQSTSSAYADNDFAGNEQHQVSRRPSLEKRADKRRQSTSSTYADNDFAGNEQHQVSRRPSLEKRADKRRQSTSSTYADNDFASNEQHQASRRPSLEKKADKKRQSTSSAYLDNDCAGNEQPQASGCPSLEKRADKKRRSISPTYADNDFAANEKHQASGRPTAKKTADKKRQSSSSRYADNYFSGNVSPKKSPDKKRQSTSSKYVDNDLRRSLKNLPSKDSIDRRESEHEYQRANIDDSLRNLDQHSTYVEKPEDRSRRFINESEYPSEEYCQKIREQFENYCQSLSNERMQSAAARAGEQTATNYKNQNMVRSQETTNNESNYFYEPMRPTCNYCCVQEEEVTIEQTNRTLPPAEEDNAAPMNEWSRHKEYQQQQQENQQPQHSAQERGEAFNRYPTEFDYAPNLQRSTQRAAEDMLAAAAPQQQRMCSTQVSLEEYCVNLPEQPSQLPAPQTENQQSHTFDPSSFLETTQYQQSYQRAADYNCRPNLFPQNPTEMSYRNSITPPATPPPTTQSMPSHPGAWPIGGNPNFYAPQGLGYNCNMCSPFGPPPFHNNFVPWWYPSYQSSCYPTMDMIYPHLAPPQQPTDINNFYQSHQNLDYCSGRGSSSSRRH